jgi:spermidine synthase
MSHIFLDRRGGRLALYLSGELQFDQRDERLYHEPLALVPTALAVRRSTRLRAPAGRRGRPLRVLILGGGDGLALREVLRFPSVAEVHLVDRDPEVLRLGKGALAGLNCEAFRDSRVRVHAQDARQVLDRFREYDVLISDLTFPRDQAGAELLGVQSIGRMREALAPEGILALNAVSPELTPRAFNCLGRTLAVAGLFAVPYAFMLPSFQEEGYGRWGFFFASAHPIRDAELRGLRLPEGVGLTPEALLAGTHLPASHATLAVAPNRTGELLAYLQSDSPLPWEEPLRPTRFDATGPPRFAAPRRQGMAAQGFARWLRGGEGRQSLDDLVKHVPVSQRGQIREALLEWSHQAEALLRSVDLRVFIEEALRRSRELPVRWVRELRDLRDRIREGFSFSGELLYQAYRVLAILLLVLVLANLFYPDNLYAKGFSSSSHGSGQAWCGSECYSLLFSRPATQLAPYRYRASYASGRVVDADGREYPAQRLAFSDEKGGRGPVAALVALTKDLQLFESGEIAYAATVPGHKFLLAPGRLRVLGPTGREVLALRPEARLEDDVRRQLSAQGALIEKAIADHRRWVDWVRWASMTDGARQAVSEMAALEAMKRAVVRAGESWQGTMPPVDAAPPAGWTAIFPGVYLEPPQPGPAARRAALVAPEGDVRVRILAPPAAVTDEDRFLFWVLNRRLTEGRDPPLKDLLARWAAAHAEALGIGPPTPRKDSS